MNISNEMTDSNWNKFDKWLRGILQSETVEVTFTKKDGTERVMNCTTNPDIIPKTELKEDSKPRKKSETTISAFDTDIKEWRSFTIRSVKKVSIHIGPGVEDDTL